MPDALIAPIWLAVNAGLGLGAWRLSRRLFPSDSMMMVIVHSLVICYACITGAALALGATRLLSGFGLLLTVAALAMGMIYWTLSPKSNTSARHNVSALAEGFRRTDQAEWYWLGVWGVLVAAWGTQTVHNGLLKFPSDWDSLMYHIPLIDQWLHVRSLYAPDAYLWSNPGGDELMGLWVVAPFSGDFLIGLTNFPAAVLLGVGTVGLASALALNRSLCHAAGLVVVANRVIPRQLLDAENDVMVAAFFVTCLCYGVRYAASLRFADVAFGSMCLGLLAGIKFYAFGYAGILWIVIVVFVSLARGRRPAVTLALTWTLGAVAWGAIGTCGTRW
jgi:hypothetical protein